MYFIATVKYDKIQENGAVKPVKEQYIFDAMSYTECEARVIEELTPCISGEFTIASIKRSRISEIFSPESDKFYLAKIGFVTLDEKTAQEKRSVTQVLVGEPDFQSAFGTLLQEMRNTVSDWEIVSIAESPILEYFPAKLA